MTISHIQSVLLPQQNTAAGSIVLPALAVAVGDLVRVGFTYMDPGSSGASSLAVSDSVGNVYTQIGTRVQHPDDGRYFTQQFYSVATAGGASVVVTGNLTVGVVGSYERRAAAAAVFRTTLTWDVSTIALAAGSGTGALTSGTLTAASGEKVVSAYHGNASSIFTPGAGYTKTVEGDYGGLQHKIDSAALSETVTATNQDARPGVIGVAVFREAAEADTTAPLITGPTGSAGASTSTKTQAENITAVHTFSANEAATWSLNGGADVARFSINSTTGALAFATAPNFEAPNDSDTNNTYVVGVRATDGSGNASTQTLTVTITNANEAPTFGGTISLPVLTATVAMASYATAGFFGDPDAGDTAAYSAIGTWPAGVTVNSGSGAISGTPTTAGTYAGLQVRRTDSGALTIDSNTFSIVVAAAGGVTFTGTVPNQSGTVGVPFTALALSGYFSGAGNFAVQSGTLPAGLTLNTTTGTISGTPTTAATSSGVVIRRTATSGIPATADTNAFSFTIAAVGGVAGFDLQTAAGCVFGQISGALAGLSREVGVGYKIAVYDPATRAIVGSESATLTTDSAGRLPRFTNASCSVGVTYDLTAKRVSDGAVASFRLAAT